LDTGPSTADETQVKVPMKKRREIRETKCNRYLYSSRNIYNPDAGANCLGKDE
jgi:hypothetical protein